MMDKNKRKWLTPKVFFLEVEDDMMNTESIQQGDSVPGESIPGSKRFNLSRPPRDFDVEEEY